MLQAKANHQGVEVRFTDVCWTGLYIVEQIPPNSIYEVRKIGTNKKHVLHRMRLRLITPKKANPMRKSRHRKENQIPNSFLNLTTSTPDRGSLTLVNISDNNQNEPSPPNSRELTVESDHTIAETCTTPGLTRESFPEIFLPTDGLYGGTRMCSYKEPNVEMSLEKPDANPTSHRSTKCNLRYNPTPNCKDYYRFSTFHLRYFLPRNAYVQLAKVL